MAASENDQAFRVGTRGSRLALWQANWARRQMLEARPDLVTEIQIIKTRGDKILDAPFSQIEGKGLFTKELDEALQDGRIDCAVHSLKDLPTELPAGLSMGAVCVREDVRDALVAHSVGSLSELKGEAVVGTSSPRRQALLLHERPDLRVESVHGNVETRLGKLETGDLDAIILATAGLNRLGLSDRITEYLAADRFVPAPGQGAVAVVVREGEEERVTALDDEATRIAVTAERALLQTLGGGCRVPIGAWARGAEGRLVLDGVVASADGSTVLRNSAVGDTDQPEHLGCLLADTLRGQGAEALLADGA